MRSPAAMVEILSERIRSDITKYYPDLVPDQIEISGEPYGGAGTARTFRFRIHSTTRGVLPHVFVKLSPVTDERNWGRAEYDLLTSLYPRMPVVEPRCRVPRPLDYYPDLEALLLEEVSGRPFRKWFLKQNSRRRQHTQDLRWAIADCGLWLKTFHALTHGAQRSFDCLPFVEDIQKDLGKLADYGFTVDLISKAVMAVQGLKAIGEIQLPLAACHHDFTPGHVFISPNGVSVIDIHGTPGEFIYKDLAYWLGSTATINAFPFYPDFDYDHANGPLGGIFLEAYFSNNKDKLPESIAIAYLFKLQYLIQRFHDQRERVAAIIHPLASAIFSRLRLVNLFTRQMRGTLGALKAECHSLGI
jgi:hypothetical protein